MFRFELGWFLREGLYNKITDLWSIPVSEKTSIYRWQNKMRFLRRHLKGWNSNIAVKKNKKFLAQLDDLDKTCEEFGLYIRTTDRES